MSNVVLVFGSLLEDIVPHVSNFLVLPVDKILDSLVEFAVLLDYLLVVVKHCLVEELILGALVVQLQLLSALSVAL